MAEPLIVSLSDDFTGMMMAASMLREAGCRVGVIGRPPAGRHDAATLHDVASRSHANALAVNTATRDASPKEAAAAVRRVVEAVVHAFPQRHLLWEKRIDTTLRGPIVPELKALLASAPGVRGALVVPAHPKGGRITVNGRQQLDDTVLAAAAKGEPRHLFSLHVPTALREGGFSVRSVPAIPASGEPVPGWQPDSGELIVFDARTEGDVKAIARATVNYWRRGVVGVDTGPYLKELAVLVVEGGAPSLEKYRPQGPILLVVGSRSPTTIAQVDHVRHTLGSACVPIEEAVATAEGACAEGTFPVVVATAALDGPIDGALAELKDRVAEGIRRLPTPPFALIMSGGLTASAVLESLPVDTIEPLGDLLPMMPLARLHGGALTGTYLVTKGGLVGETATLLHVITILQTLGRWT